VTGSGATEGSSDLLAPGRWPRASLFGVRFDLLTREELRNWTRAMLTAPPRNRRIAFSNAEFLLEARRNPRLRAYLNSCDLNMVDSIGVELGLAVANGIPRPERLSGTVWVSTVAEEAALVGASLFLLGARPGVAERAAEGLRRRAPGLVIAGTADGFGDLEHAIDQIRESRPDVVSVNLGNPRQEAWVEDHLGDFEARLVWGAGGALDFYSGDVPLAPAWIQRAGLEWLFRLATNFSLTRLRRQLGLIRFVALVARDWVRRVAAGALRRRAAPRDDAAASARAPKGGTRHWAASARVARLGIQVVRLGFLLGRLRPPRPYVVLATRDASAIRGNLAAIRRELRSRAPRTVVRTIGYRTRTGRLGRVASAWEALHAGYHLAAARLFVADDWFFPSDVVASRPGTTRVQVWHAAGAFKRFGYSVLERSLAREEALSRVVPTQSNYDAGLVSSAEAAPHFAEAFRLPEARLTSALGLPRTDVFFDAERTERVPDVLRRRYRLPDDRRLLLYAPTYRGENVRDATTPDDLDAAAMREATGDEWLILRRVHPLVPAAPVPADLAGFVVDVSDWPEMNDLMLIADLLVTDYSSAIFEFALLARPIAFLAPDMSTYEAERGFYLDVRRDLPGPVFETTEELARYVQAGTFDVERVTAFARRWFDVADGRASERFVDRVVLPALRGERLGLDPAPAPEARVIAPPPASLRGGASAGRQPAPAATSDPSPTRSSGRPIRPS
jgi:CDP-ribitol ribitolphosphotransferase